MSPSSKRRLLVLGGGVCGLYGALTALRRGWEVVVVEKNGHAGGLAAAVKRGANHCDLGVHMLHAFDREIFDDLARLMGPERIEVPLDARIRWGSGSYRYPLKALDLFRELPPLTLIKCTAGLLAAEIKRAFGWGREPGNAEEALIQLYGNALYRFFFESFTDRYWGLHPRDISAEFIRRKMPRLSVADFLWKSLRGLIPGGSGADGGRENALAPEVLHYSRQGAAGLPAALVREIERLDGVIHFDATPKELRFGSGVSLTLEDDREISASHCLSTIPLPDFVAACPEAPGAIREAVSRLRYKPIAVQCLLLRRNKAMDGLYTYFRDRVFHRVGEPKNAGLVVDPPDCTLLIVETTCEVDDEKWRATKETREEILDDLEAEGLCRREEVIEWHSLTNRHGYPVYSLGFEGDLARVREWIDQQEGLSSTGRQGGFTYPAMHSAMRMGREAVERLEETVLRR